MYSRMTVTQSLVNWAGMSSDTRASYDYGHTEYGCDSGISIAVIAVTLLGIGALGYILYTKITMGRCRKRTLDYYPSLEATVKSWIAIDSIFGEYFDKMFMQFRCFK